MTDIASLAVEVQTGDVRRARKELDDLTAAGRRTAASTEGMASTFGSLRNALGGLAIGAVAREVIQTADAYTNLSSRLGLVTQNTSQLARVQADLFSVAQSTRTSFLETGELYAKLARSTQALGKTQTETVGVTRSINQALVVSGASAQASAAALTQLGQGFASGVLRGEELNSVLEQAPRLAQAIADGLGVSVGKLRALGEAGELTADKVFGALQSQAAKLQAEFERMPATVSGALTQVGNSIGSVIAALDKASGATSKLATLLSGVSASIDFAAELVAGSSAAGRLNAEIRFLEANIKAAEQNTGVMAIVFEGTVRSQKERLAAAREELAVMQRQRAELEQREAAIGRNERARRVVPGGTDEQQAARAALLKKYATDAEKLKLALSDARKELGSLFTPEIEKRITAGLTPKGSRANPYLDEVKSLREKALVLKETSQVEETIAQISLGKFGPLNAAQQAELLTLARDVDLRKERLALAEQEKKARDAEVQATTRYGQQLGKDLETLQAGNLSLREEIELIGADTLATAAIEKARIGATIALKEQSIATLEAAGVAEQQLQVLYAEIDALRERQSLIDKRAYVTIAPDNSKRQALDEVNDFAKRARENIQDLLGDTIYDVFRGDFDKIGDNWGQLLLRMAAQAQAAQIGEALFGSGKGGNNGLLGQLVGAAVGYFGGGQYGGTSTNASAPNYENSFDRMNVKGSLAVGTNRVPDDGLYMLHKDEAVQPAAYNPAVGKVTGGNTYVTVENKTGGQVTEQRSSSGGDQFVKIIIEQAANEVDRRIASGGSTARVLETAYPLGRKTPRRS